MRYVEPKSETVSSTETLILVIDPSGIELMATAALLHNQGHTVICAQDADAATKAAASNSIDLIICDTAIDRDTDHRLVDTIRALPDRGDVPAMFIAGEQTSDIVRRTDETGSAYYLRRPFEPEVLLELVERSMWMPHLVNDHIKQHTAAPHFLSHPAANSTTAGMTQSN